MNTPTKPIVRMNKLIKPTTSIEDLPPEMICELFKHLPPKDLIVCSMVNKRWHSIHAGFKVHSLVAVGEFEDHFLDEFYKWSYPDLKFGDHQLCGLKLFSRLADQPLLSHLKRLVLLCYRREFDRNRLNLFSQLVHLEIFFDYSDKKVNLSLPKLLVLVCHFTDKSINYDLLLSIDCPKLRVLVFRGEKCQLDVKHPETLRVLETNMFGSKLAPFRGVECLVTAELNVISKSTLLSLPNLKALHYNEDIQSAFPRFLSEYRGLNRLDRMKQTLNVFLGDVKALRRSDLQFTFAGFQLTKISLEEIDFNVCERFGLAERVSNEYVYVKNYHLIDPDALHFVRKLNYSFLMTNVIGEFPASFFQKFSGINEVQTIFGVVQDARHFLWFLKSLRFLRSLCLNNTELAQEFYDHLPKVAGSLIQLDMNPYFWTGKRRPYRTLDYSRHESAQLLGFSFLRGFSHLKLLSINQKLSYDSIVSLLSLFSGLDGLEINFFCKFKERVNIRKLRYANLYTAFNWSYEREFVFEDKSYRLLNLLKELKSEISSDDEDSDYY